jgi:hypothetical protein
MPLFSEFDPNDRCDECGLRLGDIADGTVSCKDCDDQLNKSIADAGYWGHLKRASYCFFSFNFKATIVEFAWMLQRYSRTGDYDRYGMFGKYLD